MLNENDFKKQNFSKDEESIAKAMNYLRYVDPENATREDAISYLEFIQTVGKQVSKTLSFEEFFEAYKKRQPER